MRTYQLHIQLDKTVKVAAGRLGAFLFPAGHYIYTGSAKRNMEARVNRHLAKTKTLRWHIDFLLAAPFAHVHHVELFADEECNLNQKTGGDIIAPGFGASDCRRGCGSHLKYIGDDKLSGKQRTDVK